MNHSIHSRLVREANLSNEEAIWLRGGQLIGLKQGLTFGFTLGLFTGLVGAPFAFVALVHWLS